MASDLDIARNAKPLPIEQIAARAGLREGTWAPYGRAKAKVDAAAYADLAPRAKLVLVSAITPTPAGEGKTTVSIGLADALNRLGKKAMLALREPSLGPVFGVKGGAAGGGYAQVIPMEDINLHFTGDLHAVTAANTCWPPWWTTISCRGTRWASTRAGALAAVHGHERPAAARHCFGPGRQGQRHAA